MFCRINCGQCALPWLIALTSFFCSFLGIAHAPETKRCVGPTGRRSVRRQNTDRTETDIKLTVKLKDS
jgi:hypothetical protein